MPPGTVELASREPLSASQDLWHNAFEQFRSADPVLAATFQTRLNESNERSALAAANAAVTSYQSPADIAVTRLEVLQSGKIAHSGKSRQYFEDTVKLTISAKDAIAAIAALNPFAAAAWTALSFILPLFLASTQENEAALEGVNYIATIIVEYLWREACYMPSSPDGSPQNSHQAAQDFSIATIKLYASVLEFEANLMMHTDHAALRRLGRNILKAADWSNRLKQLKALDTACRKIIDALDLARAIDWKAEERKWQQAMLDQPRLAAEKSDMRKLYSGYEAAKNFNSIRTPGTLDWFLKHPSFLSWRISQFSSMLWLTADPGCGKSILSKCLIDRRAELLSIGSSPPLVCYFFFRADDEELSNAAVAVRALLHQVMVQKPHLYRYVAQDFDEKGDRFLDDFDNLWHIFMAAISDNDATEIVCVIDALDECREVGGHRKKLIRGLVELQQLLTKQNADDTGPRRKIFVTSRPYLELERDFRELISAMPSIRFQGEQQVLGIQEDINIYLADKAEELVHKLDLDPRASDSLLKTLSAVPNRTYLWLKLVFEFLESRDELTAKNITSLIESIPDVDKIYDRLLEMSKNKPRARRLLDYVLAAAAPLSVDEINVLMNIEETCHTVQDLGL